ncbi:FIST signal transduction protein [Hyunsoonleella rubra]|uniref:FIST signal transduction protein n=1 Tax=Hyunsoonleella rubra TaxID=1737062 RepID=A0ABW5TDZ6_9FLAO
MKAKSIKGKSTEAIKTVLRDSMADGFKPTLAFVFITNIEHAEALDELLDKEGIAIFGASSSQKFTEQGIEPDDIIVLLLDIKTDCFKIVLKDYQKMSPYESAQQTGETGIQAFKNPGFIISPADYLVPGEDIIKGLTDAAGNNATIMGGTAGDPNSFTGIVFTNNASTVSGLLALIIDQDKITINGLAVSGWKPVGIEKEITKSGGSWVHTIDNEPAMNVIRKFLGSDISLNKPAEGLVRLDSTFPLQFQRASRTPMMKPVLLWNTEDDSVMVGGQVKHGQHFRFSLPPDFDVIDTVVESTRKEKEKNMPDADALIVFSCVGRLETLGLMVSQEIEGLASIWNKPMIGFFCMGEFGKLDDGPCDFHSTTVSWVALKEK